VALALLVVACADPAGNDPNLPDDEPLDATSTTTTAAQCEAVLPKTCPTPPSYAHDIQPLMARTCVPCHSAGGVASDRNLTTYKNIQRLETTVLVQVDHCLMPPADAGPDAALSLADRSELLQWFVCGSPDN